MNKESGPGMSTDMALWLYNVVLLLALPVILGVLLSKARCRPGLLYRFGIRPPPDPSPSASSATVIWIHAVSLGEVVAVVPLVKALHARDPKRAIVVSTVTETGREAVLQRLAGVAIHCYAPLDFRWVVEKFVRVLRPALYVFVETELWPNLLRAMGRHGVPTIMVNGRISSRSFARQQWPGVRSIYRHLLAGISTCLMQADRDVERVIALGARPTRVRKIGNIKFDQPLPTVEAAHLEPIRRWIARSPDAPVVVAGSTHPGEEEVLVEVCEELRGLFPELLLVLAPRHTERSEDLEQALAKRGIPAVRRSRLTDDLGQPINPPPPWVLLLDTRGELGAVYQYATIAFVGGTLAPIGGHNLLEPAAWGTPVVFGPHTDHCQEIARLLETGGGGVRVQDSRRLTQQLTRWLSDLDSRNAAGRSAEQTVRENRGALGHCLSAIEACLPSDVPFTTPQQPTSRERRMA